MAKNKKEELLFEFRKVFESSIACFIMNSDKTSESLIAILRDNLENFLIENYDKALKELWRTKPIKTLTKTELIKVINYLVNELEKEKNSHK